MIQQHVIGKLIVELQLPSREEAPAWYARIAAMCRHELLPLLAGLFDDWADEDVLLQIDQLEINLDTCTLEILHDIPDTVITYMHQHYPIAEQPLWTEKGVSRLPLAQSYFNSWLYFLEQGTLPHTSARWSPQEWESGDWESGVLETLATDSKALEKCREVLTQHPVAIKRLLRQFSSVFQQQWMRACDAGAFQFADTLGDELERCCFHPTVQQILSQQWSGLYTILPERTAFRLQLKEWLIREVILVKPNIRPADLLDKMIRLFFTAPLVVRLLYVFQQLPETLAIKTGSVFHQSLKTLTGYYATGIAALRSHSERLLPPAAVRDAAAEQLSNNTATSSSPDHQPDHKEDHQPEKQQEKQPENQIPQSSPEKDKERRIPPQETSLSTDHQLEKQIPQSPPEKDKELRTPPQEIPQQTAGNIPPISETVKRHSPDTTAAEDQPASTPTAATSSPAAAQPAAGAKDNTSEPPVEEAPLPADGTVLYVEQAGLILLHPYIGILFDSLGLKTGAHFTDEAAREKAVHLLGYLAAGDMELPEYELVLPKILCGIPPSQPVSRFVTLSAEEKAGAEELLEAVITNWNALGNTSPDGLRANFLLREGKLEWTNEEWHLRVSQQSYDILLDRLPWGFGVVALSWTPWLIKTVWV
ncbi:contractile injection system tape measure protein [Chitinophaga nivalis]|uniref:Contractile injection system tape measure protein n=1 Tax=Chitinophaga nivalis TaxID=2991709 RepID=A0ABT3IP34_9BACT|nr:contractile injection system tape measure protein [Chitinophaga nivalis]MCW3464576.1 contractile injection system tape measure protein [Chitinophaga nivalis]MCW3485733.1 contractile injection system tape measure protein [Chitinophaga nivalis]